MSTNGFDGGGTNRTKKGTEKKRKEMRETLFSFYYLGFEAPKPRRFKSLIEERKVFWEENIPPLEMSLSLLSQRNPHFVLTKFGSPRGN